MTETYGDRQREVLLEALVSKSASTLLDDWSRLVEECESGYSWDYAEFLHDLQVRKFLELLATSPTLAKYDQHELFRSRLQAIDARFRVLLQDEVTLGLTGPWWRTGVLISAGSPYADYFLNAHGISVLRRT